MSLTLSLAAFALKYSFNYTVKHIGQWMGDEKLDPAHDVSAVGDFAHTGPQLAAKATDHLVSWLKQRYADHGKALPKALATANDRAWKAIGMALAGEGFFDRVTAVFRNRDMTGLRDEIRAFLRETPTGLESPPDGLRAKACKELHALRKSGRLAAEVRDANALVPAILRYGDPSKLAAGAEEAIGEVAEALAADAPHLAELLRLKPAGGTPLLASAFLYFFRREVEKNPDLAAQLTFDSLRNLTAGQEAGFALLDTRTAGILDQFDVLFDALGTWFEQAFQKIEALRRDMEKWQAANKVYATTAEAPLEISVSSEQEHNLLRKFRDQMRNLPPEVVDPKDWDILADNLDAGGLFEEALATHLEAAARARAEKQRTTEAEAEFKAYKAASEAGKWAEAKEALAKAMKLDPRRFRPFDASRYRLDAVLGVGGFGTVFRCLDTEDPDADGNPTPVGVKSFRFDSLDRDPREVFGEARILRDMHRPGSNIIRVLHWGYAFADPDDPDRKERPYIVMEFFPGETLEAIVNRGGPLAVSDFLAIAWQIVEAVREAHSKNILHRDLKPSNVMAIRRPDGSWEVRVIDFGLAVRFEAGRSASMKEAAGCATEKDRSLTGSLDFAPPEQRGKLRGVRPGPYSDVYAFGKTCQWLLFRTSEPLQDGHWKRIPEPYREILKAMLAAATAPDLTPNTVFGEDTPLRTRDFEPIAKTLQSLLKPQKAEKPSPPVPKPAAPTPAAAEYSEHAERYALWKRSGMAREWVLKHLDGWTHDDFTALVGKIKASPYWPLRADEIGTHIEELQKALRADQARLQAEKAKREQAEQEARKKAEEEAKAKDPLHPTRTRVAGERITLKLPGDVPMAFAWCPPGSFQMGSSVEKPVRTIKLTRGFYMGVFPVTQAQWKAVMGSDPSNFKGADRPVEQISWTDAVEFCTNLSVKLSLAGRGQIRLPTEAEWEYACRAGSTTDYYTGNGESALQAAGWYEGNSGKTTHPVGQLEPNQWNLYDMHGNVWEWCQDWYGDYSTSETTDPTGAGSGSYRVYRGGSWYYSAGYCRSSYRCWCVPTSRDNYLGFRAALVLKS